MLVAPAQAAFITNYTLVGWPWIAEVELGAPVQNLCHYPPLVNWYFPIIYQHQLFDGVRKIVGVDSAGRRGVINTRRARPRPAVYRRRVELHVIEIT